MITVKFRKDYENKTLEEIIEERNKVLIDIPNKRPKVPKREGWRICLGYYKEYEEAEAYIIKLSSMGLKDIYIVPYPEKIE